ncbi:MAG TPA: hypothetical protein PLZ51_04865, partial [Aggregatilineales bacterium]|nr:hypothetical protein [Aggregatilineales bacterium]
IEPLSFDIAPLLGDAPPLDWVVIGAATNGMRTYQPQRDWVEHLLAVLDARGIPVFFKGNLRWDSWREDFPTSRVPEASIPPHTGIVVNGRYHMQAWRHISQTVQMDKIENTVTGYARYGVVMLPRQRVPKFIPVRVALELLATGEWEALA